MAKAEAVKARRVLKMAVVFNNLRMPDCLSIEGFGGGFDYQKKNRSDEYNSHWFELGDVVDIDVSALLGPFALYTEAESEPVITFPNGYYIKILFTYKGDSSLGNNCYIETKTRIYDENDTLVNSLNIPGVTFGMSGAIAANTPYSYMYPFMHFKVCLNTIYYPAAAGSAANPTLVAFQVFTSGSETAQIYDEGGNPMNAVRSGAVINDYDDLVHYTQSVVHRYGLSSLISFTEAGINNFNDWLKGHGKPYSGDGFTPDKTPAGGGDTSRPGGGNGNYDDTSDPIDFPDVPTNGALDSGAIKAHRVVQQTLDAIFAKLWNKSLFDIQNVWQKSIENPMSAIVSLHALPVAPEAAADPKNLFIGNFDTGVKPPKITNQYSIIDCGQLSIKEFWGSALDYSPYTKCEIFLPFIGIKKLQIEDVMNNTLHIKYYVDVLTGDCIAFIKCGISVLYHYTGNCKMQIPLFSQSTDALQNVISATAKTATAVIGGAAVGGPVAAAGVGVSMASSGMSVAASKVNTERQGNIGGAVSLMDDFVPYLIIHRPHQSLAADYNKFKGYPSNITSKLSSLKGYTEVEHINLTVPGANAAELEEIEQLLKEGVLI